MRFLAQAVVLTMRWAYYASGADPEVKSQPFCDEPEMISGKRRSQGNRARCLQRQSESVSRPTM